MDETRGRARAAAALLALTLLASAGSGATAAMLSRRSEAAENVFSYALVDCSVDEEFNGRVKKNVQVTNDGTTDAFVRAAVIVNWLNADGTVAAAVPAGYGYELTLNPDKTWLTGADGYYYYPLPLAPGQSTQGSLLTCKLTQPEDAQYTLSVQIIASAVQSTPEAAAEEAWSVAVEDGRITKTGVSG